MVPGTVDDPAIVTCVAVETQNVLDISASNLANIGTLTFSNSPASTMPLIINVNTSGVSNSFPGRREIRVAPIAGDDRRRRRTLFGWPGSRCYR